MCKRQEEGLLCLKSIVGATVVQVMTHAAYNEGQDLDLCQSFLKTCRLIGTGKKQQSKKTTMPQQHIFLKTVSPKNATGTAVMQSRSEIYGLDEWVLEAMC